MKFIALLPFILSALAAPVSPDQFVIKAWSTESDQFKDTKIYKVDSHPHVFSVDGSEGNELFLTFGDDGTLRDQDGVGVNMDSETGEMGSVAPFGDNAPTPGFDVDGDHLIFDGKDEWRACPSGDNKFSLALSKCEGGTPIVLQKVDIK